MTDDQDQFEALLADYVDGALPPAETREVEAYLDAHPELRDRMTRLMLDSEALRSLPQAAAPVDFSEDFRGQLERDLLLGAAGESGHRPRRLFAAPVAAVAAMLVLGLGAAAVTYHLLFKRPETPFTDVAKNVDPVDFERGAGGAAPTDAAAGRDAEASSSAADASRSVTEEGRGGGPPGIALRTAVRPDHEAAAPPAAPSVASAPTLLGGTPIEPISRIAKAESLPADIAELLHARVSPSRRSLVCVVDAPSASTATTLDEQVATLFEARAAGDIALAQRMERRAAIPADDVERRVVTNADSSAVAGAVTAAMDAADRSRGTSNVIRVVRSLTENDAAQLQEELNKFQGVAASFACYEVRPAGASTMPTPDAAPTAAGKAVTEVDVESKDKGSETSKVADTRTVDLDALPKTTESPATTPTTGPSTTQPATRLVQRGERLRVTLVDPGASYFRSQHDVTVDAATGAITLPSLDGVAAEGCSMDDVQRAITEAYQSRGLIKRPLVYLQSLDHPSEVIEPPTDAVAAAREAARPQAEQQVVQGLAPPPDQQAQILAGDVIDVFVVVRGPVPATQPTTQPQ